MLGGTAIAARVLMYRLLSIFAAPAAGEVHSSWPSLRVVVVEEEEHVRRHCCRWCAVRAVVVVVPLLTMCRALRHSSFPAPRAESRQ